jgi:hypothetical protein
MEDAETFVQGVTLEQFRQDKKTLPVAENKNRNEIVAWGPPFRVCLLRESFSFFFFF